MAMKLDVKKVPLIRAAKASKRGFCSWRVMPKRFLLACCDCGLMHELNFKVVDEGRTVLWRCRRANQYTRAMRKHYKYVCEKK